MTSERGSDEVFHVTSSFCQDGGCVVATAVSDYQVELTDRLGNFVIYDRAEWDAFLAGVKNDEFSWDRLNAGRTT